MNIERRKDVIRENLEQSQHALADGIISLTDDVGTIKTTIDGLGGSIQKLDKTVGTLDGTVTKLYKIVAGDPEFKTNGLIEKNVISEGRIDRVETRCVERNDEVKKDVVRIDKTLLKITTIGATVIFLWGMFGDYLKHLIMK